MEHPTKVSKLRKTVEFDSDVLEWFEKNYPSGTLWWFCNRTLRRLMELTEDGQIPTISSHIEILSNSLQDDLPDRIENGD
jgi:hypothetical protein